MLKKLFVGGQYVNALVLVFNVMNQAAGIFPALQAAPWFLALQAGLGIFLPSVGGIAHKMAFGVPQDPAATK